MLRRSIETAGIDLEIAEVGEGQPGNLEAGPQLEALTLALTTATDQDPAVERDALIEVAGEAAAERAIGVCATFQMLNRLLDGTGTPIPENLKPVAVELGFDPTDMYNH